jgi:hypothetical protein
MAWRLSRVQRLQSDIEAHQSPSGQRCHWFSIVVTQSDDAAGAAHNIQDLTVCGGHSLTPAPPIVQSDPRQIRFDASGVSGPGRPSLFQHQDSQSSLAKL